MSTSAVPSSARFEFRLRPDAKRRIERAAEIAHESVSDFARTAVEERADHVLREYDLVTPVPADFFDEMLAALDHPPVANKALRKAARRGQGIVERR